MTPAPGRLNEPSPKETSTDGGDKSDRAACGRTFRRGDHRGWDLRGRRRLPPDQAMPGHELCRPRNAGKLRRHLDHPPISGHPLRQRPLHLRLSLQALDRRADRHRRRDPALHGRGHRGERPRPPYPLPPHDRFGALVERADSLWTLDGARTDTGESGPLHSEFPLDVPGLLPARRGLHARMARDGDVPGPDRPPAELARGSRLRRQERRRDRLRRHRGDADPGDRGRLRRM